MSLRQFALSAANSKPDSDISKITKYAQDSQFDFKEEAWDTSTLGEKQIALQKVGATVKLVTKIDGTIFSVVLT